MNCINFATIIYHLKVSTSIYVLASLLLLSPSSIAAQRYSLTRYGAEEGLRSMNIYALDLDHKGVLWLGTNSGVITYNGSEFRTHTYKDGLTENETLHIKHLGDGRMLAVSFINKYSIWNGNTFVSAVSKSSNRSISSHLSNNTHVKTNIAADAHSLFIGSNRHLEQDALIYIENGHIENIHKTAQIPRRYIFSNAFQCSNRSIWLYGIDIENGHRPILYNYTAKPSRLLKGDIPPIHELLSVHSLLYIRYNDTISCYVYDSLSHSIHPTGRRCVVKNAQKIISIDHDIFVVRENGFSYCEVYNSQLQPTTQYHLLTNIPHVTDIAKDKFGNIWVATLRSGLYKLSESYTDLLSQRIDGKHLTMNTITILDTHRVYLGDYMGHLYQWSHKNSIERLYPKYFKTGNTPSNPVKQIVLNHHDIILVRNKDLLVLDTTGAVLEHYLDGRANKYLSISQNGDYYLGTSSSILRKIKTSSKWEVFQDNNRISALCISDKDKLWYSTNNDVYCMDLTNQQVDTLGLSYPEMHANVSHIYQAPDKIIWVCFASKGIMGLVDTKLWVYLNHKQGLEYGNIHSIFSPKKGQLWLGTDYGLYKIEYKEGSKLSSSISIIQYTASHGLPDNNVLSIKVIGEKLLIATSKGLVYLSERDLAMKGIIHTIFNSIKVNQRNLPIQPSYVFDHDENYISIKYGGVYYGNSSNLWYQYRIKELDTKWTLTTDRMLQFGPLPPGLYTFEVVCVNERGKAMGPVAKFRAEISPAFYQQIWFKIMLILISILFGWFMIRWYIRKKGQEDQLKLELAELEMQAVRAQMNPHFIFNCLNSIQHMVNQQDTLNANRYIAKFSHLIRQTLELSKNNTIPLSEELSYIENYMLLETMRFQNSFDYQIIYDKDQDYNNYFIPSMIMQPYIENAIRHVVKYLKDRKGLITIEIIKNKDFIVCKIDDNGIGRTMSATHKQGKPIEYQSRGTELNQKRIDSYNVINPKKISIFIEDKLDLQGNPVGTCVHINLPV